MSEQRDLPQAVWEGDIDIAGVKLKCFVLDDGRRIIDADSFAAFLAAMADERWPVDSEDFDEIVRFVRGGK